MPLEDFAKVLDRVAEEMDAHRMMVITTGGEPLMRSDIVEVGKAITSRGFYWGLVTNGMSLSKQLLYRMIQAGLSSISVSIDGLEEDHNWMRGHQDSFSKAVDAARHILSHREYLAFDVITCVNKRSIKTLPQIKDLLYKLGVRDWRLVAIFPSGRAAEDPLLFLDGSQVRQLMDFIKNIRLQNELNVSFGCEGFLGPYEHEVRDYQFFCQAGINVASIRYDGAISGCLSIRSQYDEGNIYMDDFVEVWNKRFYRYRNHQWMKTGVCSNCEVWRWCQGNGMHLRDDEGQLTQCLYQKMFHPTC